MIRSTKRTVEKPIIIIAQDNSQSIAAGTDSIFYKTAYLDEMKGLINELNDEYDVMTYTFGENVDAWKIDDKAIKKILFTEKQTDFEHLFQEINTRFSNRNVGAMILATDGIYNKGTNPLFMSKKYKFPLFTIALGDTSVHRDLILSKVDYNRIAYLGNQFPVEVIINANMASGTNSVLKVYNKGKLLSTENIKILNDQQTFTVNLLMEAKETGIQKYSLELLPVSDEISIQNNKQAIFIDVLDSRQKILILASTPHPDISALKQAIETNSNYQVDFFIESEFTGITDKYNLAILHQIPSKKDRGNRLLYRLITQKIPLLFIIGATSDMMMLNNLKLGFTIESKQKTFNESLPEINDKFTLFTISDDTKKVFRNLPPLYSPFGRYSFSRSSQSLLHQKIGNVSTQQPMILFDQNQDRKIAFIVGEGIWKWKLNNYAQESNHKAFDEIINKTIQYLSLKVDKSFFRIYMKNNFMENENVQFDAEVYNESFELINDPEINLTIFSEDNKKFPFIFSKSSNSYMLNAGTFPVGNYSYTANVNVNGKVYKESGEFSVSELNIETVNIIANHQLLYQLAVDHYGEMYYPEELDQLLGSLNARDDIKSVSYTQKRYLELINIFWVLILILSLLTIEWFIRKRSGAY
ncbi:hypothetical protein ACFL6I_26580 [candidate division KSB1 bacterium]